MPGSAITLPGSRTRRRPLLNSRPARPHCRTPGTPEAHGVTASRATTESQATLGQFGRHGSAGRRSRVGAHGPMPPHDKAPEPVGGDRNADPGGHQGVVGRGHAVVGEPNTGLGHGEIGAVARGGRSRGPGRAGPAPGTDRGHPGGAGCAIGPGASGRGPRPAPAPAAAPPGPGRAGHTPRWRTSARRSSDRRTGGRAARTSLDCAPWAPGRRGWPGRLRRGRPRPPRSGLIARRPSSAACSAAGAPPPGRRRRKTTGPTFAPIVR